MLLELKRSYKGPQYTIGHLYVNGQYFCDTLEDVDRGLDSHGNLDSSVKIKHQTAIPYGKYEVAMNIQSPRFSLKKQYKSINGFLPRLLNVPLFDGILIHIGNDEDDSSGCILVGENKVKGKVINSTKTFFKLYSVLKDAHEHNEKIEIEITPQ